MGTPTTGVAARSRPRILPSATGAETPDRLAQHPSARRIVPPSDVPRLRLRRRRSKGRARSKVCHRPLLVPRWTRAEVALEQHDPLDAPADPDARRARRYVAEQLLGGSTTRRSCDCDMRPETASLRRPAEVLEG